MSKKQFPSTRSEWFVTCRMVNYMEIQDFVELPCISLLRYTWNDTENVLENCETIFEKVFEKCLTFFFWKPVLTIKPHPKGIWISHVPFASRLAVLTLGIT